MSENEKQSHVTIGEHRQLWLARDKSVEFKPFKGRQIRDLAEIVHKHSRMTDGARVGKLVSLRLQYMCVSIAGAVFWESDGRGGYKEVMPFRDRMNFLSNMYQADVLCAYLLLRIESFGDGVVSLPTKSPFDSKGEREVTWKGDIESTDLMGAPTSEQAPVESNYWTYELRFPCEIRNRKVTGLVLGPAKWSLVENIKFDNVGAVNSKSTAAHIKALIVDGADDVECGPLGVSELDDMHGGDLNRLAQLTDENAVGPDFETEVWDPVAGKNFKLSIPWYHPAFFALSSQ